MIRVLTGVGRPVSVTMPSVEIPPASKRLRSSSPARSRPTTPMGMTRAPSVWTLWAALAAPPRRASRSGSREVGRLVADDARAGQVEAEVAGRAQEQPRLGLATVAVGPERRRTLRGMVGTDVEAIEMSAGALELLHEALVHRVHDLLG